MAALAGVSRSTVSRVVNGSPKVSEATRAAVDAAIAQLGYLPNPAARTLVTRRTGSIALVVRETEERVFGEPFFAGMVRGISGAVASTDLQLVLLMAGPTADPGRLERYLFGGHTDGVLLLSLHGVDPLPVHLAERGIPTVLGGRPHEPHPQLTWVDADNVGGARLATEHLVHAGRRRIATVTGPLDMVAGRDRLTGYRDALRDAGLPLNTDLEVVGGFTREGGREAARQLLDRHPDVDAIVAASDLSAAGVLEVLQEAGRRIPDDVAVTGFDDSTTATSVRPALTTVRQDLTEIGAHMVRLLLEQIESTAATPAVQLVLPTTLVRRASA
ncbi:LacI family DNA-binding transcriptional regulator [Nitriliruptor alkaliphilus]|uniref:LacI family DNA-binding transcriptional regulator n=1 Tax=Nitriliruptor alkaliphilus TaxID=427918 RepID=UPI001B805D83|nr:LacI family DNA-binding transcriptional regulator [Nitriliruptor alkaliphilus]